MPTTCAFPTDRLELRTRGAGTREGGRRQRKIDQVQHALERKMGYLTSGGSMSFPPSFADVVVHLAPARGREGSAIVRQVLDQSDTVHISSSMLNIETCTNS